MINRNRKLIANDPWNLRNKAERLRRASADRLLDYFSRRGVMSPLIYGGH